jgi:hypothetical protein
LDGISDCEVLPNTKAIGIAKFLPSADGTMIGYTINVTNIDNVTMGDLHVGKAGEFGPVVVYGKQISDLVNIMKNGQVYINIHTQRNPKEEIRGQII